MLGDAYESEEFSFGNIACKVLYRKEMERWWGLLNLFCSFFFLVLQGFLLNSRPLGTSHSSVTQKYLSLSAGSRGDIVILHFSTKNLSLSGYCVC